MSVNPIFDISGNVVGKKKNNTDMFNNSLLDSLPNKIKKIAIDDINDAKNNIYKAITELNNVHGVKKYLGEIVTSRYDEIFQHLSGMILDISEELNSQLEQQITEEKELVSDIQDGLSEEVTSEFETEDLDENIQIELSEEPPIENAQLELEPDEEKNSSKQEDISTEETAVQQEEEQEEIVEEIEHVDEEQIEKTESIQSPIIIETKEEPKKKPIHENLMFLLENFLSQEELPQPEEKEEELNLMNLDYINQLDEIDSQLTKKETPNEKELDESNLSENTFDVDKWFEIEDSFQIEDAKE